jgi:hypothetical protein
VEDESPRYVLNDIALIQIVEKKPKSASEFAVVAGGALSPVAKAHSAEVVAIVRNHTASEGGGDAFRGELQQTPLAAFTGGGGLLLEVWQVMMMVVVVIIIIIIIFIIMMMVIIIMMMVMIIIIMMMVMIMLQVLSASPAPSSEQLWMQAGCVPCDV